MNKRIKELVEEAGFILWGNEEWGPGEGHVDWSCDYKDELAKYTELIVRECAEQVKNLHANKRISGAEIIREHFGVEE